MRSSAAIPRSTRLKSSPVSAWRSRSAHPGSRIRARREIPRAQRCRRASRTLDRNNRAPAPPPVTPARIPTTPPSRRAANARTTPQSVVRCAPLVHNFIVPPFCFRARAPRIALPSSSRTRSQRVQLLSNPVFSRHSGQPCQKATITVSLATKPRAVPAHAAKAHTCSQCSRATYSAASRQARNRPLAQHRSVRRTSHANSGTPSLASLQATGRQGVMTLDAYSNSGSHAESPHLTSPCASHVPLAHVPQQPPATRAPPRRALRAHRHAATSARRTAPATGARRKPRPHTQARIAPDARPRRQE